MSDWSDEETDDPIYADRRNFCKVGSAAVAAITTKAKLAGLWREKVAQTDPSGENGPRYILSERPLTEEEWIRERCGGE